MTIAKNPILSGFYPDPSICAVGEDFYIVNSTFAYFPGLPVMHSRDLAHWEQIGNVMDRAEQLPLGDCGHSQGLFAPTIRFHDGTFYVICTNVSYGGNYVVTATDPAGPWSNPYYLEGADGIDPSLFFDDDGKCYYIGTHPNPKGCRYNGDYFIWIQELDLSQMKLVGEAHDVWNGAMRDIPWPEGPHLYKKDGWYYIMNAEGGTGPEHAVAICRSKTLFGPYENNRCNPILTHRHLGKGYPIKYVGHGDLVETANGEWYMVMLAVRPTNGYTTMGRETFLAKVVWEDGWPIVNPGIGMLTDEVEVDLPEFVPATNAMDNEKSYDFRKMGSLGSEFLTLRNAGEDMYALDGEKGLGLLFQDVPLTKQGSPSFVAIRQRHHRFVATAKLSLEGLIGGRRAGLALMQSNEYHLRVEISQGEDGEHLAEAILCKGKEDAVIARIKLSDVLSPAQTKACVRLSIQVDGLTATIGIAQGDGSMDGSTSVLGTADISALSTEVAGGFVGCVVGVYALSDMKEKDYAWFEGLTYKKTE